MRLSLSRHLGDIGQFCTICVILSSVFTYLIPLVAHVKNCSGEKTTSADCRDQAYRLKTMQQYLLVLNLLMLAWDILRFAGNSKDEARPPSGKDVPKHL